MKRSKPGRPSGKNRRTARQKLIQAGIDLLKEKNLNSISIRDVASEASVNTAMIYHYFKNREGLFEAVIMQMYSPIFQGLQELKEKKIPKGADPLFIHMGNMGRLLMKNPWLPKLVTGGILGPDSPFRDFFAEKIAGPLKKEMTEIIEGRIKDNVFRQDINATLLIITAVSLTAMPHICKDMIEIFNGAPADNDFYKRLQEHNFKILNSGIVLSDSELRNNQRENKNEK